MTVALLRRRTQVQHDDFGRVGWRGDRRRQLVRPFPRRRAHRIRDHRWQLLRRQALDAPGRDARASGTTRWRRNHGGRAGRRRIDAPAMSNALPPTACDPPQPVSVNNVPMTIAQRMVVSSFDAHPVLLRKSHRKFPPTPRCAPARARRAPASAPVRDFSTCCFPLVTLNLFQGPCAGSAQAAPGC